MNFSTTIKRFIWKYLLRGKIKYIILNWCCLIMKYTMRHLFHINAKYEHLQNLKTCMLVLYRVTCLLGLESIDLGCITPTYRTTQTKHAIKTLWLAKSVAWCIFLNEFKIYELLKIGPHCSIFWQRDQKDRHSAPVSTTECELCLTCWCTTWSIPDRVLVKYTAHHDSMKKTPKGNQNCFNYHTTNRTLKYLQTRRCFKHAKSVCDTDIPICFLFERCVKD